MRAIYVRQSLDKKDSISIESQIDFCKREFDTEDERFKVYIDKGFSGKNINRPAFSEMIENIKEGLVSRVIVYKLDRISRSTLDFANINNLFKKYNVDFTSCTEKFDTSTPMGKAMLQIIMVFAELERETIQQRVTDNYYERGKKGFFLGGTVPYGYTRTKINIEGMKIPTLEENPSESEVLNIIYNLYSNTDMSLGKISNYLNERGITSAFNRKWDSNKVSRIMRSPLYVKADADIYQYYKSKGCIISNDIKDFIGDNGCYLFGKREANERKYTNVENHTLAIGLHKGIIDSNTWLLCQYKLDSNKQIKNTGMGKHSWLSGLTKCGYCGYSLSVVTNSKSPEYKYFNCRGKTNLKICKGHSKTLNVSEIEALVEDKLLKHATLLSKQGDIKKNNGFVLNNNLKIQLTQIEEQIDNLLNQISEANNITMKYINEKITSLDTKRNKLLEEIKKSTIKNNKTISVSDTLEKLKDWEGYDIVTKKSLCKNMITRINIKDDDIEVIWAN